MPLVDRGVVQMNRQDLHDYLGDIMAPLEILVICMLIFLFYTSVIKYKIYWDFPANLFSWVIITDLLYACVMGPFRFLKGNPFYDDLVTMETLVNSKGCRLAVFMDSFLQISLLYTNTVIVGCAFAMVYFKTKFAADQSSKYSRSCFMGLFTLGIIVGAVTCYGNVSNYVGWCTANSASVIFKQLMWFLALVIQITMIIPTNYIIWDTSRKSKKAISTGFYLRFIGIAFTQIIGLFPLMGVEFLSLARKPVPSSMMWCCISLFPLAHYLDFCFLSMKVWPKLAKEMANNNSNLACCVGVIAKCVEEEDTTKKSTGAKKKKKDDEPNKKEKRNGSIFDSVPFWLHLMFTLAVPFLLLASVSLVMLFDYLTLVDKAILISADIELSTLISNYIHETQKERGATGVFMGSKGSKFKCEISSQYTVTNVEKKLLEIYLGTDFRNVKLVTKLTFLHSLIYMLNIENHREDVQQFTIPKSSGVSWYSVHNMFFVGIVSLVCRDSHLDEETIIHYVYANLAFVSGKEKAGVERAKGSVAFAAGQWTNEGAYRTFVELVAAQDNHLYFFETYVADENLQTYRDTLKERVTIVSIQMRLIALEADPDTMGLYTGGEWFDNMTAKINLIRAVETVLRDQLTDKALGVVQTTTDAMIFIMCTLAFVLIIDGLMLLGLARTSDHLKRFQVGQGGESKSKHKDLNILQSCWHSVKGISFVVQVLIPVILCGCGLIVVSWLILKEQVSKSQLAASTWENMNLQGFMSNFIHETQKERGATGVYMGSGGVRFSKKLYMQSKLCDTMRVPLFKFLNEEYIDYDDLQLHFKMVFWVTQSFLLENHRIHVRYLNITSGQGLGYYTVMNAHIIGTVSEMALRSSSNTVEARLLAYLGFMYMKEKAGNERAVGTLGMGQGYWPSRNDWMKFIQLVAIQRNAFVYFEQFGSEESKTLFTVVSLSKANEILNVWQKYALENDTVGMISVDSALWFNNCTIKINEWRLVEVMIAVELDKFFEPLVEETANFILFVILMLGILFVFTVYIGVKGIRLLLRSNAYNLYQDKLHDEQRKAKRKKKKTANK